jgi:hypothetical protein
MRLSLLYVSDREFERLILTAMVDPANCHHIFNKKDVILIFLVKLYFY